MLRSLLNNDIAQSDYCYYNNLSIMKSRTLKKTNGFIFNYRNNKIIIINKNKYVSVQKNILLHEIAHLELNHCYTNRNRTLCENEADDYIRSLEL